MEREREDRLNRLCEERWMDLDAMDLPEDEKTRIFLAWFNLERVQLD